MNSKIPAEGESAGSEKLRLILRAVLQAAALSVMLGLLLFLPAQDLEWPMAWALIIVYVGGILVTNLWLALRHTGLARERLVIPPSAEKWDASITRITNFNLLIVMLPLSGFDYHQQWSPFLPIGISLTALFMLIAGFVVTGWAMSVNEFFSSAIRVQFDRGQTVATGGPYRLIRHPGYLAMIAQFLAVPLMLGSLWALIPAAASVALYIRRTTLEDDLLLKRLPGYIDYARRVRFRLIPGIW